MSHPWRKKTENRSFLMRRKSRWCLESLGLRTCSPLLRIGMLLCDRLRCVLPLIFRIIVLVFICLLEGIGIQHQILKVFFESAIFTAVFLLFRAVQTTYRSSPDLLSVDPVPPLTLFQPPRLSVRSSPPSYPSQHSHSPSLWIFLSISHSPQPMPQAAPSTKHYSHFSNPPRPPSHSSPEANLPVPLLYLFPPSCFTFIIQFDNQ